MFLLLCLVLQFKKEVDEEKWETNVWEIKKMMKKMARS